MTPLFATTDGSGHGWLINLPYRLMNAVKLQTLYWLMLSAKRGIKCLRRWKSEVPKYANEKVRCYKRRKSSAIDWKELGKKVKRQSVLLTKRESRETKNQKRRRHHQLGDNMMLVLYWCRHSHLLTLRFLVEILWVSMSVNTTNTIYTIVVKCRLDALTVN